MTDQPPNPPRVPSAGPEPDSGTEASPLAPVQPNTEAEFGASGEIPQGAETTKPVRPARRAQPKAAKKAAQKPARKKTATKKAATTKAGRASAKAVRAKRTPAKSSRRGKTATKRRAKRR